MNFSHASQSFRELNPALGGSRKPAKLERHTEQDPLGKARVQKDPQGKFLVRLVSVTNRLYDEDNICEKYHVDILRYAGVLPSDAPGKATIQTLQRKCKKGEEPHVEIEVYAQENTTQTLP